nr:putative nuclease HARBI1 [Leptinotarsa decemlineata]
MVVQYIASRERSNFVILTGGEFVERFRHSRQHCQSLLQDIGPAIANITIRGYDLSPLQKLLIALHWFGNGGQYHGVCDMHGVSKMTDNTGNVIERFHNLAGFPEVYGAVDGILINMDAPTNNEPVYVDRHGKHSINCMAVCGPDFII